MARLPPCLARRVLPRPQAARAIHTSASAARQPTAGQRQPTSSSSSRSYPRPAPSFNAKPGKSTWEKNRSFPPRQSTPSPSSITTAVVLQKLETYLKSTWVRNDASITALAIGLGVDSIEFGELAQRFGVQAVRELARRESGTLSSGSIGWDVEELRTAYVANGVESLKSSCFRAFVVWASSLPLPRVFALPSTSYPTLSKLHHLHHITDFRNPGEQYPSARQLRRRLILHVGPTNSGKTHSALVALARARTGVYAGPLRLLAHEVFSRFNEGKIGDEGKRVCNLITGEEQRILDPNASLSSCTVEMFPLQRRLEVGVIDEIQMIGDSQRGSAWTSAVIGSQCDELHLCGEESVVELIQKIAEELGDDCEVRRYERLSPLVIAQLSLGSDLSKIRRGDCLVTFSRNNIFAYKRFVEEKTGLRVAVAYGGLPPEVREEQARVFNEGGYDVLVASDAVGMGLNLKIKRIVFETLHKWDGKAEVPLSMPQIKQIAGRAGRFGVHTSPTAPDDAEAVTTTTAGEVTTLDAADLPLLREAMQSPIVQVAQAALSAPVEAYRDVNTLLPPSTRRSKLYSLVGALSQTSAHYAAMPEAGSSAIVDAIEHIHPLTFDERSVFANAPVNMRDSKAQAALISYVESFAAGRKIIMREWSGDVGLERALERVNEARALKERPTSPGTAARPALSIKPANLYTPLVLAELESYHRCLTLYLWLSYRLPGIFCDDAAARPLRKVVESAIDFVLAGMKFEKIERKSKRRTGWTAEAQTQMQTSYEEERA